MLRARVYDCLGSIGRLVGRKDAAQGTIQHSAQDLVGLSHSIHAHPETAFEEVMAAAAVAEMLERGGLAVEVGYAGLATSVRGTAGSGPLQVVVCAEYDALPGIGHACGHNVIAAAAVGAGLGLAGIADDLGLEVVVLGTPAEESGGGKVRLVSAGAFEGAHAAMMVHPAPYDVVAPPVLALEWLEVAYTGKEAHASAFPEEGVNAADGLTVAQVAIGLLRQHLNRTDRVHGYVTHRGRQDAVQPAGAYPQLTSNSKE